MSDARDREKREIALAPGSYAYMQDTSKGIIKTYVGPTVINQTGTEVPVVWNATAGRFDKCATLEDAVRLSPVAEAEGRAKAKRAVADAEAYYNATVARSITPALIQYESLRKWNGTLPTFLGGGSPMPFVQLHK